MKPKYPVYIPSKNRADVCYTAQAFLNDGVDFRIVVEPSQQETYCKYFDPKIILVLPEDGLKLLGSRLWIREHALSNGFDRHWQFDDNIRGCRRLYKGKRIPCNSNLAMAMVEEFTDRYSNVGVSGMNYTMFVLNDNPKPFTVNTKVYSASLINNRMPHKWRLYYNDDTDLCLQVVTNGMCTIQFNAFMVDKIKTMVVKGGNTDDLYQKDGRLIMARALEEVWPGLVTTRWRFGRPQHVVRNSWKEFNHPLIRRTDIDWEAIEKKTFNITLQVKQEVKSKELKTLLESINQ